MGKLIDIDKARNEYRNLMDLTMSDTTLLHTLYGVLDNAPTVEAIPKADYENRLKADMVAMLEEIQMEVMELPAHVVSNMESIIRMDIAPSAEDVYELIQQKIDKLKGT